MVKGFFKKRLKFKIPFDAQPQKLFALEKREYPLVLGVPNASEWKMTFKLPAGAKIEELPKPFSIETECIDFKREVTAAAGGKTVSAEQSLIYKCERISVDRYPMYREEIQKLRNALDEDVTVKLK